ncbi:unnamed protein product, partial [Laminaria digitata]
ETLRRTTRKSLRSAKTRGTVSEPSRPWRRILRAGAAPDGRPQLCHGDGSVRYIGGESRGRPSDSRMSSRGQGRGVRPNTVVYSVQHTPRPLQGEAAAGRGRRWGSSSHS